MTPVVKPGQVWESRDIRDYVGPSEPRRRVRVVRVHDGRVHIVNTITGRQTHPKLAVFAGRQERGGYRKVADAPPEYDYRIVDPKGHPLIRLTRSQQASGYRIQRMGPTIASSWEDLPDG